MHVYSNILDMVGKTPMLEVTRIEVVVLDRVSGLRDDRALEAND